MMLKQLEEQQENYSKDQLIVTCKEISKNTGNKYLKKKKKKGNLKRMVCIVKIS